MATHKNPKSLFAEIERKAQSALKNEVAKTGTEEMSQTILHETYVQYTPTEYERRGVHGGLADTRNMTVELINDNTISITNDTTGNEAYAPPNSQGWDSGTIDEVIVTGEGYHWEDSEIYNKKTPRDFYEGTKRRLDSNKRHIEAMREGLKKRGLDVR